MASTAGEKEIKTKWPVVEGLEADEKHTGRKIELIAERGSFIPKRKKRGL